MPLSSESDWYDRHQVRFATALAILMIAGPAVVAAIFLASGELERLRGTLPFIAVGGVGWTLLQQGRVRLAMQFLVYAIWVCAVNALLWTHGLTGTTIGAMVVTLAFAGWLAGPTAAIILTAATPPVFYLLAYLDMSGWPILIGANVTSYQRALFYSITAVAGGALGYFGAASLRERLGRLQESRRELRARLAELESRDEALLRSQERFETLFRSGPSASVITDPQGRIVDCNQSFEQLVGCGCATILGRTTLDFGVWKHPEHRERAYELIARDGQLRAFETEWSITGESRTVLIYGAPLELNREPCILFHITDITERKRAEIALKDSEARSRSLVEAAFDGILTHDRGMILDANLRFAQIFGYDSPDELIGRQGLDILFPPASRELIRQRIAASSKLEPQEVTGLRKDGTIFLGETQSCDWIHQGKTVRTVTMRDITERKRAEDVLRASEEKFAKVFRSSPMFVAISTLAEGRYIDVNEAYERRLGYARADVIGRTSSDIGFWKVPDDRLRAIDLLVKDGRISGFQAELSTKSGDSMIAELWGEPIEIDGRQCIIWIANDITERKRAEEALRESEHKFATLFNTVPDAIIVTRHSDGRIVEVNPACEKMLGYSRDRVLGNSGPKLGVWADPAERATLLSRLDREDTIVNCPVQYRHADGHRIDALVSAVRYDYFGEPCILWTWTDIGELRAAEQALMHSENRYRSLFQAASDCILVIDRDGRLIDINGQGSRTLGYTRDELLGEAFTRVLDAHLLSRIYPRPAHVLAERRSVRGEQELISRSGSRHYVEFVANPLPDGNVLVIVRDVTERKNVEQLLANISRGVSGEVGEAFFESLVRNLCTGLGADHALIGEVVAPDNKRVRTRAFVADGEKHANVEYALEGTPCANALTCRTTICYPENISDQFPADADLRDLGVQGYIGTPLRGADGSALGVLVVMSRQPIERMPLWASILEIFASRAAAEIERSRAEHEVRELNLSLERKVAERTTELQTANRDLESFSYSVSHDLRAPLRAISGFSEILRVNHAQALGTEAEALLRRIERNAARMNALINDLLELSRTGRKELERRPVAMRSVVESVLADLRTTSSDNAFIEVGELPSVQGDLSLLRQVWQNLIGNAIKYSRHAQPPRIEIGSVAGDGVVEYYVRDNGAGFDMAYADKLFGVFQRLHSAEEFEGTGVGLAIVQRILARHGGIVSAEGAPGKGATFRFTLPAERLGCSNSSAETVQLVCRPVDAEPVGV
jgi:PAS domain S-box-containing protein